MKLIDIALSQRPWQTPDTWTVLYKQEKTWQSVPCFPDEDPETGLNWDWKQVVWLQKILQVDPAAVLINWHRDKVGQVWIQDRYVWNATKAQADLKRLYKAEKTRLADTLPHCTLPETAEEVST